MHVHLVQSPKCSRAATGGAWRTSSVAWLKSGVHTQRAAATAPVTPKQLITVIKTFVADPLSARPRPEGKYVQRAAASVAVAALPLLGAAVRHAACARGRRADVLVVVVHVHA